MTPEIEEKLALCSTGPGVYLMHAADGGILYVGKAKNLKRRVSSYFRPPGHRDLKTGLLVEKIASFETILTATEKEALILEHSLIKRHNPRYNVILKDGKRYLSLRIDPARDFPRIEIVRKVKKDGAWYFGPYAAAGAARETLRFIHKNFRLRKCKGDEPPKRPRPCLFHQMNQCLGPCCLPVSRESYHAMLEEAALFLKGRALDLLRKVQEGMAEASAREEFELAAELRDRMFALQKTIEKQVVVTSDQMDRDVIGLVREPQGGMATVLFIRGGQLIGSRHFPFAEALGDDGEICGNFIRQYYEKETFIPKEILAPEAPEDTDILEDWLTGLKGERARVLAPKRGEKARLLSMARENALDAAKEHFSKQAGFDALLERLAARLSMDKKPARIECFDISNLQGGDTVAAMAVFQDGVAAKDQMRRYKVRGLEQPDDYAAMAQALGRRFKEKEGRPPLPDLLMVDGGRGQLSTALEVLRELGLEGAFPVIGIAKPNEARRETSDKIFRPGQANPVVFGRETDLLLFLARIRDETHRQAVGFHRKKRDAGIRRSALDTVPGIGEKRKQALLKRFGSVRSLAAASVEEIAAVPGVGRKAALEVARVLCGGQEGGGEEALENGAC
jgi:excinuclease ABC subunit C